jgi:hypothetical protein
MSICRIGLGLITPALVCSLAAFAQAPAADAASDVNAAPITVQIAPPTISYSAAMMGVSTPLGAQPISGKPLYAEFVTEHHQSFTDGNRISRSSTSSIYRDAQGRIRRESQLSIPGLPANVGVKATFITIVDQQLGYGYILNPQELVARRYELNPERPSYVARLSTQGSGNALLAAPEKQPATAATDSSQSSNAQPAAASRWRLHGFYSRRTASAAQSAPADTTSNQLTGNEESGFSGAPAMRIDQPFLAAPNPVRTENLGEQTILGFRTRGTRVITTLPAGEIGNDRPIDIVSEQWFSPELEVVMRSLHRDPWAGEFTTSVVRIKRGEQPASLFEIPEHYTVVDASKEEYRHILDGRGSHAPGVAPW